MRASVLFLLGLSACRGPEAPAETRAPVAPAAAQVDSAQADMTRTRAEAAGLTGAQADELEGYGVPVYVSNRPAGWALAEMTHPPLRASVSGPCYDLRYTTPAGACLTLSTAPVDGDDPFTAQPPHERTVDVPGVQTEGPARLG